ncbi:MAG: lipoprotein [Pseudomonadales bacterium]
MRWLVLLLLVLQVATCGQKGPLTLPEQRDDKTLAPTPAGAPIRDGHA